MKKDENIENSNFCETTNEDVENWCEEQTWRQITEWWIRSGHLSFHYEWFPVNFRKVFRTFKVGQLPYNEQDSLWWM